MFLSTEIPIKMRLSFKPWVDILFSAVRHVTNNRVQSPVSNVRDVFALSLALVSDCLSDAWQDWPAERCPDFYRFLSADGFTSAKFRMKIFASSAINTD